MPLSDTAIRTLVDGVAGRGPLSLCLLYMLDGAYATVDDEATAFGGGRSPRLNAFIVGQTPSADGFEGQQTWARALHAALAPVALDGRYLNGVADPDDEDRRTAYGTKLGRLEMIRRAYDPEGLFAAH